MKALFALSAVVLSAQQIQLPRTADGKPNLQGIWQVRGKAAADLKGIVEGGTIPYQPWAATKKQENFTNRLTADPVGKCFFPASLGSCTWSIRSRFSKRPSMLRSRSSGPRFTG